MTQVSDPTSIELDVDLDDPEFIEKLEDGDVKAINMIYLGVDGIPLMGTDPESRRREFVILYFEHLLRNILSAGDELIVTFKLAPGRLKAEQFNSDTIILSVTDRGKHRNRDLTDGIEASKEAFVKEVLEEAKKLIDTVKSVNPDLMDQSDVRNLREHIDRIEDDSQI